MLVVLIDETGKVTGATVKESAHPVYDRIVAQADAQLALHAGDAERRPDPVRAGRDDSGQALTHQREQNHITN